MPVSEPVLAKKPKKEIVKKPEGNKNVPAHTNKREINK